MVGRQYRNKQLCRHSAPRLIRQPARRESARRTAAACGTSVCRAGGNDTAGRELFAECAPGTLSVGGKLSGSVVLNGAVDVSEVALQLHYDPTRLALINLSPGDLLTRDGQAAPPIHTDQPVGI